MSTGLASKDRLSEGGHSELRARDTVNGTGKKAGGLFREFQVKLTVLIRVRSRLCSLLTPGEDSLRGGG